MSSVPEAPAAAPAVATGRLATVGTRARDAAGVLWPHIPIAALVLAYAIHFSQLSVAVYDGYGSPGFDMSIPDQGIWLLSRFHAPFVTVMGRNLFADHSSYIFLLLVPVYWIYPHAQALLVIQSCVLAAAAIPIYMLALRRLENVAMATILAGAYLLNPALQNGNLEQVHVEFFTVLFVALAIYAAVENKGLLLAVATVGLLLCKEDTALLVIPLAAWVAWRRNRVWGLEMFAGAVVAAVAANGSIFLLLGQSTAHGGRLPFGGVGGLARTTVLHPARLYDYLKSDKRPFYVWQMLGSFGFVMLLAPEIAAIGVLVFAVNILASFGYEHEINYHYSLPLVPVLALGTVFAVSRLSTPTRRYIACAVVAAAAVWTCILWGLVPLSRHPYTHQDPNSAAVLTTNQVLKAVPPNAVISAYYPWIAHLDHRVRAYQWPTPFRAEYWATYHQEGQPLPFADQIQYVIIPSTLSSPDTQTWAPIASQFTLVAQGSGVSVYRRIAP